MDLSDQNSTEFGQKAREYRERINLLISRSKYRKYYDGVEILALDGFIDEKNTLSKDLIIHFLLNFDASSTESFKSVEELKSLFIKEFKAAEKKYFKDLNINTAHFQLKEISFTKLDDFFETSHLNINDNDISNDIVIASEEVRNYSPRKCEPVTLKFCKNIGNYTTMPNLLGHRTQEEMQRDLISFREVRFYLAVALQISIKVKLFRLSILSAFFTATIFYALFFSLAVNFLTARNKMKSSWNHIKFAVIIGKILIVDRILFFGKLTFFFHSVNHSKIHVSVEFHKSSSHFSIVINFPKFHICNRVKVLHHPIVFPTWSKSNTVYEFVMG